MESRTPTKIKVLFIAGWGRSGSTILDNVLNQVNRVFSTGELRYFWDRGLIENRLCGCGAAFRGCPIWKRITEEAFGSMSKINPEKFVRMRDKVRTRHLLLLLLPFGKHMLTRRINAYLKELGRLYEAIYTITGCNLIVDSSKFPSHGFALSMMPNIDLHVVHIVRDPRAVAHSWSRFKFYKGKDELRTRHSMLSSCLYWLFWNLMIEFLWARKLDRYFFLKYETFVLEPVKYIKEILAFSGECFDGLTAKDERHIKLNVTHTVSGNPSRFLQGIIEIKEDQEWRNKMSKKSKILTSLLTLPLFVRYRYTI